MCRIVEGIRAAVHDVGYGRRPAAGKAGRFDACEALTPERAATGAKRRLPGRSQAEGRGAGVPPPSCDSAIRPAGARARSM